VVRAATAATLLMGLVAVGAGCGSSSKSGSGTTTTASRNNFTVTLPQGQASLSLTGQLPPGWPSGFPLPDGAKAAGSGSLGNSSSTKSVAVYTTTQSPQDVYNFYLNNAQLHVTDHSSAGIGSTYLGRITFTGSYSGSLVVLGRGTTYLVIALDGGGSGTAQSTTATSS
jgi:hypothetical protein